MKADLVIGLDFGTDSVRAVLVDAANGKTISTSVHYYEKWRQGLYCNPADSQFRQHIRDHLDGLESTIKNVLSDSGVSPESVRGICVDTTGSSPVPTDKAGTPLCLIPGFTDNPNAMMVLWKDHTAISEAEEINELCRSWGGVDYTKYEGGIYSSEWFWAKILHVIRNDAEVRQAAASWVEHCDLITHILTGSDDLSSLKRSRCAAGHKAMWHESWGGLPSDDFLSRLDPYLVELKRNLYTETFTSDQKAGYLSHEWAGKLGLSTDVVLAVGTFDAHAGAVGAEVEEKTLVRVMGTSTCDIIVSPEGVIRDRTVAGICGQVDGSVIPGMVGLEAGQSAFGDLLAWFRDVLAWPLENLMELSDQERAELREKIIEKISQQASELPLTDSTPVALDWINGRRTPDANQALKAAIMNLDLGTRAPEIFQSLVLAICFGSRRIVERFVSEGVDIERVVGIGGVAKKSAYIMQTLADVLNMPIKVAASEQAPALGAAMYAATAAGLYNTVEEASKSMGNGFDKIYHPNPDKLPVYDKLYQNYLKLGEFMETI